MVTAFWRGLISGLVVLVGILVFQGLSGFLAVRRTGWAGVIYILLLGSTTPAFVMAVSHTSVANVVFIFASTPIFATIFSRIYLGEPLRRRMVLTMIVVMFGLGVIAYGSRANEIASWEGDLWAVYVSVAYAAALTAVRRAKHISMIPAIPIAYIGTALVLGTFTSPLQGFEQQWPLFLGHGITIGVASCLLTLGPRYISSVEVSLLILLESVLAPILVWAVVGENPGFLALVGGSVVIVALVVSNLIALRSHKRNNV